MRVALLTAAALVAFAGNSILCRLALADGAIDPASFTAIRIASGAAVLLLLVRLRSNPTFTATATVTATDTDHGHGHGHGPRSRSTETGSWPSALALFLYAAPFSYAYLTLGAGMGALVLFASVQTTMIAWGVKRGHDSPRPLVWLGLAIALAGLFALTLPGADAPDPAGLALMIIAGVAWGVYSLRGRTASAPLVATAGNFARAVPPALALLAGAVALSAALHLTAGGVLLAVASGALASGLGYSIWYAALPHLPVTSAAILQLLVPVLAAAGGVALLAEPVTGRLLVAGGAILGGVAIAIVARRPAPASA